MLWRVSWALAQISCNNVVTVTFSDELKKARLKSTTSPQICRCTTLWKSNVTSNICDRRRRTTQQASAYDRHRQVQLDGMNLKQGSPHVGRHYSAEMTRLPVSTHSSLGVHNSQSTGHHCIERIVVGISGHFNLGQAYVAVSRCCCSRTVW